MKTIKTYLTNLPKGVKWVFGVNISIYLLCLITLYGFNYKLQNYLGFYPTYSENFNPLQLITDMFTHSTDINHIFFNMLFFLIFAPFVENKLGTKLFIISYFICGTLGNIFVNYNYHESKVKIEQSIKSASIEVKDIKVTNFLVDESYLDSLNPNQVSVVSDYNYVISKSYGASSSLFGIILIYVLLNFLNIKKVLFNVLCIYLISVVIIGFIFNEIIYSGSDYAHVGGLFGGLLLFVWVKIKKGTT